MGPETGVGQDLRETLVAGEVYRSAQPTAEAIAAYSKAYGIRTILNLRGEKPHERWYRDEVVAAERNGIRLINFPMSASAEIDRTLVKLETLAKERGLAVGVASALPISIERIAAWTKTLDSRGIMLVPLTTAMLKSKSG